MKIQRARVEALPEINQVIAAAKAVWNYPPEYLNSALKMLEIREQNLDQMLCFEILSDQKEIVGFFAVSETETRTLEHLWIRPDFQHQGLGRSACHYLFRWAQKWNWPELIVLPDPPSEGFYSKLGFQSTMDVRPSRIPGGPEFRIFKIETFPEVARV